MPIRTHILYKFKKYTLMCKMDYNQIKSVINKFPHYYFIFNLLINNLKV